MDISSDPKASFHLEVGDKHGEGPRPITNGETPFEKTTAHDYCCFVHYNWYSQFALQTSTERGVGPVQTIFSSMSVAHCFLPSTTVEVKQPLKQHYLLLSTGRLPRNHPTNIHFWVLSDVNVDSTRRDSKCKGASYSKPECLPVVITAINDHLWCSERLLHLKY